jgi:hypothetical protein
MTICVSVRVAEGLVMAADSAAMLQGEVMVAGVPQMTVLQGFQYATKVAQVGDFPMGFMTWGLGAIDSRSIQSLVMEFEFDYSIKGPFRVQAVADDLLAFILKRYDAAFPSPTPLQTLGLFVGGYSDGEFFSTQMSVELPTQRTWVPLRATMPGTPPEFGANWFGAYDALQRLIVGWDQAGTAQLVARGVSQATLQAWADAHESALQLPFDGMPLQDAIDFALWATNVVIGRWRFAVGPNIVGGEVDIAVIRPRSFQWAQRKQWSVRDDEIRQPVYSSSTVARRAQRDSPAGVPDDGVAGEPANQVAEPGPAAGHVRNRSKSTRQASRRRTGSH